MKKRVIPYKEKASSSGYNYREVICNECEHRFMWLVEDSASIQINGKIDLTLRGTICPKCSSNIIVKKGILRSVDLTDQDVTTIKWIYGLR